MSGLVCVNGHAMDSGLFECPACGAYRPSRSLSGPGLSHRQQQRQIRRALAREVLSPVGCERCRGTGRHSIASNCQPCPACQVAP